MRAHPRIEVAILAVLIFALGGAISWELRRVALAEARTTATNFVELLDEQTRVVFQMSDLALRAAKQWLEREELAQDDPVFRAFLTDLNDEISYTRALYVIGADGFILHDTDYPHTPRVSLADRGYFRVHRDTPGLPVFVGEPIHSRSVMRWFVPLARRFDRPDGEFAGIVAAALEPLFFERIYRRLQLKENDAIALFHADSTLIARVPAIPELFGRSMRDTDLFAKHLPRAASGVFEGTSAAGRTAIIAYRKLDDLPLVVTVIQDRSAALAGWRDISIVIALAALLIVTLIVLLHAVQTRRRLERQIERQRALSAEKLESIGYMASSVAHDVNNLLAAVGAGVGLIRKRGLRQEVVDGIEEALARGKRLTDSLLEFARHQDFEKAHVRPHQQIAGLELLIRQAARDDIEIQFDVDSAACACYVSQAQLEASILNIVVNATQAMPDGGTLTIAVRQVTIDDDVVLESGEYTCIAVTDTGHGIPEDAQELIFEPFFTTKKRGGTGLGLSQVKNFAVEAGGDVRVTSTVGVGTRVELLIPCASAPAAPG